ncbi:MAG: glycosyltransferase family 39 protein [Phycisphaerae bacterium]|nr:glycosyltransferase family 39 protein [Phycisphaerae bacterium]
MAATSAARTSLLLVSIAAAVATVAIGWTSARGLETLWDEQVDHEIALGLLEHPLTGEQPTIDGSQTRLPMYVNAVGFALTGRDDLAVSRGISLVFAAITVIVTGLLGCRLFGPLVGAMAAVLLAISPYFLSFGRISMTEGDVFLACFMTLAIWGSVRYLDRPSASSWMMAAVLFGLALGAKIFAVVLLVVFGVLAVGRRPRAFVGWPSQRGAHRRDAGATKIRRDAGATKDWQIARATEASGGVLGGGPSRVVDIAGCSKDVRRLRVLLAGGVIVILVVAGIAMLSRHAAIRGRASLSTHAEWAAVAGWLVLLVLCCSTIVFVVRRRVLAPGPLARFVGMAVLAAMTFFAVMPVHLVEHDIAREIVRRVLRWDHQAPLALWSDHLRLYAGILLVKLTLPLGVLTCGALLFGVIRGRSDLRWRMCILTVTCYVVVLCLLPLRQTFYLMGIYPLIGIMTAAFAVGVGRWMGAFDRRAQAVWAIVVVGLLLHLGVNVYRAHPWYHLYGYKVVGNRWLGAESRGYRNLVQTPSDGVESLIRWCNTDARVGPGDRVVSFLWEQAIIDRLLPDEPRYVFVPRGVSPDREAIPPPPSIDDADFVLLHINNLLGYGDHRPDCPPEAALRDGFSVVYAVRRGPMDVAWVYARR